ncbi:MAG: DUF2897 family protein [Pseudomonadota bacterium]|nr:DUF2897 family protein [Pseudomonadota bacterium]
MDVTWTVVIILLVLGVIVGNITLLKYSAKFKFPTPSKSADDNGKVEGDNTSKSHVDVNNANNAEKKKNGFDDEDDW